MKHAVVKDAVHCGFCGSKDIVFAEDVTNEHKPLRIVGTVLVFRAEYHTDEIAANECIRCRECGEESLMPEGYTIEFVTAAQEKLRLKDEDIPF